MLPRERGGASGDIRDGNGMNRRPPRRSWTISCCGAFCVLASLAAAQQTDEPARGNLQVSTIVEKIVQVTRESGDEKPELVPVDVGITGDAVVYTIAFENTTSRAVDNVRITNPIPRRMRYIEGSAFGPGADVLYSVDGGKTYGKPSELVVATEDGTSHIAAAIDYTHIRWVLKAPLDAGAKGFARFRAVVR
jgi:uncharacterized repeat protein (TIGR01451 family)